MYLITWITTHLPTPEGWMAECGCAGKTVKSLQNTCHTWALLQWWFTMKRRYIKCMHPYLCTFITHVIFLSTVMLCYYNTFSATHIKQYIKLSVNSTMFSLPSRKIFFRQESICKMYISLCDRRLVHRLQNKVSVLNSQICTKYQLISKKPVFCTETNNIKYRWKNYTTEIQHSQ